MVLADVLGVRHSRPVDVDLQWLLVLGRGLQRLGVLVPERRLEDLLSGL
jgi:hypothetical protein